MLIKRVERLVKAAPQALDDGEKSRSQLAYEKVMNGEEPSLYIYDDNLSLRENIYKAIKQES